MIMFFIWPIIFFLIFVLVLTIIYFVSKKNNGTFYDFVNNPKEYKNTGTTGERYVYRKLLRQFPESQILRNVYLYKKDGKLTEIDLLLITQKGILVFESKNYSGWISGNEYDSNWFQTFPNGMKFKLFNPIIQNNIHVTSVKKTLSMFSNMNYFSIIVFGDKCSLANVSFTTENVRVIYVRNLVTTVNEILFNCLDVINEDEMYKIINLLNSFSRPAKEIKARHIKELTKSFGECPKCGHFLVRRINGYTGETFLSCKGFPKCKFTSNDIPL